ncbi:hypothetical protein N8813_03430 [bacterium]|nr:hypothetical protein [bacterium]
MDLSVSGIPPTFYFQKIMAVTIKNKSSIELGVVPTHIKFVGGLAPDDSGKLPRGDDGKLLVVTEMGDLIEASPVEIDSAQVPYFAGADAADVEEMINDLKGLGLTVHLIMMVGGADPMNPADEDKVVDMLKTGLEVAKSYDIENVSSTSFEEWMQGEPKVGDAFDAAVAQVAKVHARAYEECDLANSPVQAWHIEFLRGGEMQTFTSSAKCFAGVKATNDIIGNTFFKVMVDAAHCGDSDLTIPENEAVIREISEAGALGIFHASAKTTRGCLSTDDGWIGALLTEYAKTGNMKYVFVEIFHHEDPALEPLRDLDPGHGLDTTDGRTYSETVIDGLVDVTRRLNNLVTRGMLS